MKIRFATNEGVEQNTPTWLAVDTDEIVAFQLNSHPTLFLWFKGMFDCVIVSQKEIGKMPLNFYYQQFANSFLKSIF